MATGEIDRTAALPPVSEFEWPSPEVVECPFAFYQALREQAPVYKYPGRNEYLVSRWEDITYVAQHSEVFSHRIHEYDPKLRRVRGGKPAGKRYTPYGMASSDPPEHKIKRQLTMKFVARERLRAYEPMVQGYVDELIDSWIDRGECDFRDQFSDPLPILVIMDILGLPREDMSRVREWGGAESQGARYMNDDRVEAERERQLTVANYMREALLERYEEPRDDFLSELVQAQVELDGELEVEYLTAEGTTLLFAGNVTTAHMLASMMVLLCEHPEEMDRLRGEPAKIRGFVDETLRLESPVQWHLRITTRDTELGGVAIPKGATVVAVYGAGNRDETRFPDPDEFAIDRPNLKHQLGFGYGPHLCLGAPLARLEGQVAFERLLSRLSDIRLTDREITHIENSHFRAPSNVRLSFRRA